MKRYLTVLAVAVAVAAPTLALAAAAAAPPMATVVCRAPLAGEKANDMMGTTALVCRHLNVAKVQSAMTKIHGMMSGMKDAEKTGMSDAMSTLGKQFTLPMYPGEYPSGEYQ